MSIIRRAGSRRVSSFEILIMEFDGLDEGTVDGGKGGRRWGERVDGIAWIGEIMNEICVKCSNSTACAHQPTLPCPTITPPTPI
jgi:hypothetical protein